MFFATFTQETSSLHNGKYVFRPINHIKCPVEKSKSKIDLPLRPSSPRYTRSRHGKLSCNVSTRIAAKQNYAIISFRIFFYVTFPMGGGKVSFSVLSYKQRILTYIITNIYGQLFSIRHGITYYGPVAV